jgi:hypothetical protein
MGFFAGAADWAAARPTLSLVLLAVVTFAAKTFFKMYTHRRFFKDLVRKKNTSREPDHYPQRVIAYHDMFDVM